MLFLLVLVVLLLCIISHILEKIHDTLRAILTNTQSIRSNVQYDKLIQEIRKIYNHEER